MKTQTPTPNTASMADIAFLLLIFFMVTTTITQDKGLDLQLPPYLPLPETAKIHERNLFTLLLNSNDELLVEGDIRSDNKGLRDEIHSFILNYGQDATKSDDPASAVISIKTNRGTSQQAFIQVLDEAKAAYFEIYADQLGISSDAVRSLDLTQPAIREKYKKVKQQIPMNISIAEPNR